MSDRIDALDRRPDPIVLNLGPLPKRWKMLGVAIVFALAGLSLLLFGTARDRVRCARDANGPVACVVDIESLFFTVRRASFTGDDVREVRWVPYTGSRNARRGKTELILTSGRSLVVANGPREGAHQVHRALAGFLDDPTRSSLEVAQPRRWGALAMGGVILLISIAMVVSFFRRPSSIQVVVDRSSGTVTARPRRFGVMGRATTLSLRELEGIEVEPGKIGSVFESRHSPGYRVVLHYESGDRVPLSSDFLPGEEVHERAAAQLREALGFAQKGQVFTGDVAAPAAPGVAAGPGAQGGPAPTGPQPVAPQAVFPKKMLLFLVPFLVLFLAIPVVIFVMELSDPNSGTLEVRCLQRCKFGSSECLQGGHWRRSIKAGSYTFQVWNPNVPGNWEPRTVQVEAGRHTVFVCEPSQP